MTNISIFAKDAFLNVNPNEPLKLRTKPIKSGHVMRVSSMIRGDQIAEYLGAKLNPTEDFEDDVCIYVKPHLKNNDLTFDFKGKRAYLDIIDGDLLGKMVKKYPEVGIIVCSEKDYRTMTKDHPNKVIFIPQHHCNYDNIHRDIKKPIKTIGVIGTKEAFPWIPQEIKDGIKARGLELIEYSRFFSREDIVEFYKNIDIQLVWRPYKMRLCNPLKLVNAASFGIPTIALTEEVFDELNGYPVQVNNIEQFFIALDLMLETDICYLNYSTVGIEIAKRYHIDRIGELYKQL